MIQSTGITTPPTTHDTAFQGMQRAQEQVNEAAKEISEGNVAPQSVAQMVQGSAAYAANGAVIQTERQMAGTLMNLLG